MNFNVEYKVFENIERVIKYFKKRHYSINKRFLNSYRLKTFYWVAEGGLGPYWLSSLKELSFKEENRIKQIYITSSKCKNIDITLYFYFDKSNIYTLQLKNDTVWCNDYIENKLFLLTHGPKAISIPDAFRVLSL